MHKSNCLSLSCFNNSETVIHCCSSGAFIQRGFVLLINYRSMENCCLKTLLRERQTQNPSYTVVCSYYILFTSVCTDKCWIYRILHGDQPILNKCIYNKTSARYHFQDIHFFGGAAGWARLWGGELPAAINNINNNDEVDVIIL